MERTPRSRFSLIAVFTALIALVATDDARPTAADEHLKILRITPAGDDVPPAEQIVIEFDRPVVPLGRMERTAEELPIRIEPALNCQWRWLNRQALACNLHTQDRMAEATRYTVTVEPGIETTEGITTRSTQSISFITRRPAISNVGFKTWLHPGLPVLRVIFNQPVSGPSLTKTLTLFVEDQPWMFNVTASPDPDDRELPRYIGVPGEKLVLDTGNQPARKSDDQATTTPAGDEARRVWLVEPTEPLPLESKVTLHVADGLVSALGPEPGIARPTVISFDTFPELRFLGVRCSNNSGKWILIAPDANDIENPEQMCNPLAGVALSFSAPVLKSEVARTVALTPDLAGGREDYDPWENQRDWSRLHRPHRKGNTYEISFPEHLKAFQAYQVKTREPERSLVDTVKSWFADLPLTDLKDEFGRTLAEPIDIAFWTNHRNPDFTLVHHDAVLEAGIDSEVPLYVTNLNALQLHYRSVGEHGVRADQQLSSPGSQVEDVSYAVPLRAREMTAGATGAVFGSIASTPMAANKGYWQRRFFAQVTPYQVHAKVGHFNTLVWVTDLATGAPVADATVSVYRDALNRMGSVPESAISTSTDSAGTAVLPGTTELDPKLETFGWRCSNDTCEKLFIRVDGDKGMALLPLNRHYRVNVAQASGYQVHPAQEREHGHIRTWGTTAQGVYRAGDAIQFKIYVRDQSNEQLVAAPTNEYTLELIDPAGKVVHTVESITLNQFGAFSGEYEIPTTAVMGWHQFRLTASFTDYQWHPMRVLVSDFTPAAFRVTNQLNGDLFRPGEVLVTRTQAALHSGGAYTQAEARVTVHLRARGFSSSDPVAGKFQFDTANRTQRVQIHQEMGQLTNQGTYESSVELAEQGIVYGRLSVESAVRDDRGKYIAAATGADYVAIDRLVGLRKDRWVFDEDQPAEVQFITVDEHGEPVDDTAAAITVEHLVTKASRVKGAGNAYITQFVDSWEATGECAGTPQRAPVTCSFIPADPGRYRIVANIQDTRGRAHSTTLWAWVAGKGQVVWREDAGNTLEMIPEANEYRVGDTARFLIKNPFPGATALVTLERYGVIDQWQTTLQGSTPILEIPIDERYVPGAYLSVLVFSPRVDAPPAENREGAGEIDLGKPAFRIGYAELPVIDPYKQLEVAATTNKTVYKPREQVEVSLRATPTHPPAGKHPVEFAVVVLDEAVFDLIQGGRDYFDPYKGFYSLDGLDVDNYSLLMRIVGRQRFEKKGANAGGDGGDGLNMRTVFKYVSYWNPALRADAQGKASFEFSLPDNLTGWRVLAMAVTPTDRVGLGDTAFKTNQPTEIRPVMPNQVTEEDQFQAGFAVMNRTDKARTLKVEIRASGDVADERSQITTEIALEPYQRRIVQLPVTATRLMTSRDTPKGSIQLSARAWDAADGDALTHQLPVLKRRSFEVAANYGSFTNDAITEPIAFPQNIYTDVGGVSVGVSPSVIGDAEGAFRYLRDYDYLCWEQVLTKGVMASHFKGLSAYLDPSLEWPESDDLPRQTLQRAANYQAPNGGMTYYIPVDQNVSPYLSAYTALAFNWLRDADHEIPASVEEKLHGYLLRLLRRDEVPTFYSRGMTSTVRAVALNALAQRGKVNANDVHRYADHLPHMDLFGAANFLDAAHTAGAGDELVSRATNHVLARSITTGGKLAFSEEVDDGYLRILTTQLRTNCSILSALARVDTASAPELTSLPTAMVRSITQTRGNRDHWENTQENAFCVNALIDYARRWENVHPRMRVAALLDGTPMGSGEFASFRDPALVFEAPITAGHPGRDAELVIRRQGEGRLYYSARVTYSPTADAANRVNAGIDVRREYAVQRDGEWVLLSHPAIVNRGELVRVDLFVNLPSARNFVIVDDHVPGGLEPVNRDLATASGVDADAGSFTASGGSWWFKFRDWISYGVSRWSFYHREMRHDAVRFYSEYLPPGHYHLSYTAQAIAMGSFAVRPAHAGEMYDTDVYGKTLPMTLQVQEPP